MNTSLPRLMETADFTPFFRSTVGFDRLMRMLEDDVFSSKNAGYPPYNIEKTNDDSYRITMAVAGFGMEDIAVTVEDNRLHISGSRENRDQEDGTTFLHRGIATRSFEQRFQLADHIEVRSARLENGLLAIDLVREVPEHKKPRKITVNCGESLLSKAQKLTKRTA